MDYAVLRSQPGLVEANDRLHTHLDYRCPCCGGRVSLVIGTIQKPHFRHLPGEGTLECEEYVPGSGGIGESGGDPASRYIKGVEDIPAQLGLCMDPDSASLYLRIPELTSDDLRKVSLPELASAQVVAKAAGLKAGEVSALELRPGAGRARMAILPTLSAYSLEPAGQWPEALEPQRWRLTSPGLTPDGTIFRLRRGEWTRLRPRSLVEWGEQLYVVGPTQAAPPLKRNVGTSVAPIALGAGCYAWRICLPVSPDRDLAGWLSRLGHLVVPPALSIRLVRVPDVVPLAGGRRRFVASYPAIAEIRASASGDKVKAMLDFRMQRCDAQVSAQGGTVSFLRIDTPGSGMATLTIGDDRRSQAFYEIIPPPGIEALQRMLQAVPRLRIRVGEVVLEPWGLPHRVMVGNEQPPHIELLTGAVEARVTVAWGRAARTNVVRDVTPEQVEELLQRLVGENVAQQIFVDAGGFGRFNLVLLPTTTPSSLKHADKLPRTAMWASIAPALQGPHPQSTWVLRELGGLDRRIQWLALRGGGGRSLTGSIRTTREPRNRGR